MNSITKHGRGGYLAHRFTFITARGTYVPMLAVAILLSAGPVLAGLYDDYGYRATIQFSGYNKSEPLTNFPALVVLNAANISGFDYSQFLSGSNDLRFTDSSGLTNLNFEIEKWDTSGNSYVWVQTPVIANANASLIAYWGMSGQVAPPSTTNGAVWADGFKLVEHMAISNGTTVADATASNRLATIYNTYAYTPNGMIGSALGLGTARNSGIQANNNIPLGNNWTISSWFKDLQPNGDWRTLARGPSANHHIIVETGTGKLGSYIGGMNQAGSATLVPVSPSRWRHIAAVGTGSKTAMYVDGVLLGTGNFQSTEDVKAIGYYQGNSTQKFADYLDEYRIESYPRSSNWVWACYMNVASNTPAFQAYGAATLQSGPRPPAVANLAPSNIVFGAAFLNGRITSTGSAPVTAAAVYWGTMNGGTDTALWANTNIFTGGPWNKDDVLTTNITTLTPGQDCFYTYFAANADGGTMAAPSRYFTQGALTLLSTDNVCGTTPTDTATVMVLRPSNCTGGVLTVYYTTSGEATNGVHYTASPASGSLLIAAGATNAFLTITPQAPWNGGAPKAFTVTLTTGAYLIGSPDTVACTLETLPTATYTWDGTTSDWTIASHWTGGFAGLLPANGSTGIIASGTAQLGNPGNLYNAGAGETPPAEIRVQSGGKMLCKATLVGQPSLNDHHLILDGGIVETEHMDNGDIRYDHPISVRGNSTVAPYLTRGDRTGKLLWYGTLKDYDATHTGQLTKKNIYGRLWLGASDSPFTGGWNIPEGLVGALAKGALGTGNIVVTNGGAVGWSSGGDTALPTIIISNGSLVVYGSGTYGMAPGKTLTVNGGSIYQSGDYNAVNYNMPVSIAGNLSLGGGNRSTESWNGDFINLGGATITLGGVQGLNFTKLNNAYTGNWIIPYNSTGYGTMTASATANGALGAGGFVELRSNSLFSISQSLTLRNIITGHATLGAASKTLTLQPWYTNATLYAAGMSPGTNWGAAVGTLNVSGNLTFTNQVNYDGLGSTAYCRLAVDVAGPAATPTNDILAATGNIAGLNNVDLYVSLTNATPSALNGRIFVFMSGANAQDPKAFHQVVPPPGATVVITTNGLPVGCVGLLFRSTGTMLMVR